MIVAPAAMAMTAGCVDDLVTLGFELVPADEEEDGLLCPHREETSRPYREKDDPGQG